MANPTPADLQDALRRLVATGPHGHRARPVKDKDRSLIEAANDSEYNTEFHKSLRCWDCGSVGDRLVNPVDPNATQTWGDVYHEDYEAWRAAKELLDG